MTTVLLYQPAGNPPASLPDDVRRCGLACLGLVQESHNLVHAVRTHAPEVLVCALEAPDEPFFSALEAALDAAPCAVLLLSGPVDSARLQRGLQAGVHALVADGYAAARLLSLVELAQLRRQHEDGLRHQLAALAQRLDERKSVERAKGILMRARKVSDDEAFDLLRSASMHASRRIGQVSDAVILSAGHAEAVNRSGQLRMLSQKLVKWHIVRSVRNGERAAGVPRKESLGRVEANLAFLRRHLQASGAGAALEGMEAVWTALRQRLMARLGSDDPQQDIRQVDALAERMLGEAEALTEQLERAGRFTTLHLLNVAGRQRMLSQRFAKACLIDLWLDSDGALAQGVAQEFARALAELQAMPLRSATIRVLLREAGAQWLALAGAAGHIGQTLPVEERLARSERLALESEALLATLEQLCAEYESSVQMLFGADA